MRVQTYVRKAEREGGLSLRTKLAQALGGVPYQVVDWTFATFLLLFFTQVMGLPAGLASAALTIAVIIDAIFDLAVGSFSDGLVTKWGRRHPLMYASVVPLALALWSLFSPPELSTIGLFAWLLLFALASRMALSLFSIPWNALFPEMTDNYVERSEILAYRWALSIASVAAFQALVWGLIFRENAGQVGQLVRSNYLTFAPVLGLLVAGLAGLTTLLTHREIKYLRQPLVARRFSLRTMASDLRNALKSRNFLLLFVGLLLSQTITGTVGALRLFSSTYFWQLTAADLKYFAFVGVGALLALASISKLNARFEKRGLLVAAIILNQLDNSIVIGARFLNLLPDNGDPRLLAFLVLNEGVHSFMQVIIATLFYSMVADTVDEQELRTGARQEGVFSAAIGFSSKAITGFGVLGAGLILQYYIGLSKGASPGSVPEDAITRLGIVMGFGLPLFYLIPAGIIYFYSLSRAKHATVLDALAERTAARIEGGEDALRDVAEAPPA